MPGTVPEQAEIDELLGVLGCFLADSYMALYNATVTLGPTTVLASLLAAECTFAGYGRAHLASWTVPAIDSTTAAVATTTLGKFTPTGVGGSGLIVGYFLVNLTNTAWYGAESFPPPGITLNQGITLEVDCTYSWITRY